MADEYVKAALYWISNFNRKAKEKIWMEKLTELLREYNMSNQSPYILWDADYYVDDVLYAPQIISKSYWFIEWLVENEKIDVEEINKNLKDFEVEIRIRAVKDLILNNEEKTVLYLQLLMLLAIQDEPISFLISLLK